MSDMTILVAELYDALRKAGVDDDLARAAAKAVIGGEARDQLATKADVAELKADVAELRLATKADVTELRLATKADLAELEARVIKWNVGTLVAMTGIFAAIVKLL
jgi:hypothetical protein